jgi:hypothetical protein
MIEHKSLFSTYSHMTESEPLFSALLAVYY